MKIENESYLASTGHMFHRTEAYVSSSLPMSHLNIPEKSVDMIPCERPSVTTKRPLECPFGTFSLIAPHYLRCCCDQIEDLRTGVGVEVEEAV